MKDSIKRQIQAIILFLLSLAVIGVVSLTMPWYLGIPTLILIAISSIFIWKKMAMETKRKISENLSIIITGFAAFVIVGFVIYLLVHIFILGKGHLSWDFFFTAPREGLSEGGIFPAIVGTALLVIIMSLAGVPIGTITAIYLTEYASEKSKIARFIRFAVNTLAGVPAIVFGLFGLGFFISTIGSTMDTIEFKNKLSKLETIISQPTSVFVNKERANGEEIRNMLSSVDAIYWKDQIELTRIIDDMYLSKGGITKIEAVSFFKERKRPHWGQPALIWAALTMALLTLPVVIVSVEEAIKTVPRDLREASLALGATKFTTIRKVVIPGAMTGILTGAILAVSRGAGEVAPILFTGAAYYLPELPNSLNSQFMELGYHIYVLSTQSTNIDATLPVLYSTTLTLLILTFTLNFSAIFLRSRVRAKQLKSL